MNVKAAEQRIRVLEVQNKRLSEKVDVQKAELGRQQQTLDAQSQRWSEAQTAVLAVRRGWTQLHEDIREITRRAGLEGNEEVSEKCAFFDPLVSALLAPASARTNTTTVDTEQSVRELTNATAAVAEATDLEIKREAEGTTRALASLLQRLETAEAQETAPDELDLMRAFKRVLVAKVGILEDTVARRDSELNDVKTQLADVRSELESAQRKILSYKNAAAKESPPTNPQSGSATASEVKGKEEEEKPESKALRELCVDSMIHSKIEELEKERREHLKTQKELNSLRLGMQGDEWVCDTRLYKSVIEQKHQLTEELEKKRSEIEHLTLSLQAKDREISKKRSYDPETRVQSFASLKEAQKKLLELQQQVTKNEKVHESAPTAQVDDSTAEEYRKLLASAQEETSRTKKRLKESVGSSELVKKAREEAIEAGRRMRSAESRMEGLTDSLKELEDGRKQMKVREDQLRESKEDLQVFVNVLMSHEVMEKRRKDAEAIARDCNHERETKSLKRKIEELERVCGNEDLQKEVDSSRKRLKRLREKLEQLQVQVEVFTRTSGHQAEDLEQQKQLNTYLQEELEQTGMAYEEKQGQIEKLLKDLSEKEITITSLKHQISKSTSRIEVLTSLVENLETKVKCDETDVQEIDKIKTEFEGRMHELTEEIRQLKGEIETLQKQLNEANGKLSEQGFRVRDIESQLEVSQQTVQEQRQSMESETKRYLEESHKRQKVEADAKAFGDLKRKLKSGSLTKADIDRDQDVALLNQEVESMRRCLNCNVCSARPKSVILMKCMHTFCKPCIDNRIETRSRRCPGCGSAFSREEVRPFYLA